MGLMPGLGTSPGEENGNLLQYSCLENPMDRGAWRATIRRVTKSWTWLGTSPTQKHGLKITTNSAASKTEIYAFTLLEARSPNQSVSRAIPPPETVGENPLENQASLRTSGGCQQSLAFLALRPHLSSLCLHIASPLSGWSPSDSLIRTLDIGFRIHPDNWE